VRPLTSRSLAAGGATTWATSKGTLVSPRRFRRLIKPHFARLYGAARELLAKYNPDAKIMAHTDGDVYPILPDYVEESVASDALNPVQPYSARCTMGVTTGLKGRVRATGCHLHGGYRHPARHALAARTRVRAEAIKTMHALGRGRRLTSWRPPTTSNPTSRPKTSLPCAMPCSSMATIRCRRACGPACDPAGSSQTPAAAATRTFVMGTVVALSIDCHCEQSEAHLLLRIGDCCQSLRFFAMTTFAADLRSWPVPLVRTGQRCYHGAHRSP